MLLQESNVNGGSIIMQNLVVEKVKLIDEELKKFYLKHNEILSVFIAGSMYDMKTYCIRQNNDYDIRFVVKEVTPLIMSEIKKFEKELCDKLEDKYICLKYSNLVGPVNHNLSEKPYNLLLHMIIHTIKDLHSFLPLTHQLKYKKYHRLLCGENYLNDLIADYDITYLINCHEGIYYCIDMLKRNVYKYFEWSDTEEGVTFEYKEKKNEDKLKYELVFYSIKNIVLNIYEIKVINQKINITFDDFLDTMMIEDKYKNLLKAVFTRDEKTLDMFGMNLNKIAVQYLTDVKDKIIGENIEL